MILALIALVVGGLLGTLVAYRLLLGGATANSRRTLAQLEETLEGLESAYRLEVATLDARREINGLPRLPSAEPGPIIHVPRRAQIDD